MANIGYIDPDGVSEPILKLLSEPLSNLHWKAPKEPLRSINQLKLNFIKNSAKPSLAKQTGKIVKENDQFYHSLILQSDNNKVPYVTIFFVKAGSIEDYRNKTRPMIRSWSEDNNQSKAIETEWLIVIVGDDSKSGSLLGKPSLFAKIKTDMNGENENHCVKISDYSLTTPEQKQEWGILVTLLKEKVLNSFTKRLELYRHQLLLLQQRPVINPYFKLILKNYIMKVYRDMTLDEASLNECDQLTSSFTNLWKEGALSFNMDISSLNLNCFGDNPLFDDNIDFDRLILDEKMNVLQFHCYSLLFASNSLLALASSDTSLTFSTMHIVDLLKRVKLFITNILGLWENSDAIPQKVYQFNFLLVDEFLSNDLVLRNIDLNLKNADVGKISDVMELIGELKMTQRDQLVHLGERQNLRIAGLMSEISISEEQPSDDFQITYEPLIHPLSSQESFANEYISRTKEIIEGFNSANTKPRTVDILSTEMALIAYNNGNYLETKSILGDSFEYYNEQGWNYIGNFLLKIYIDCLEKTQTEDFKELLKLYLDLLSTRQCEEMEAEETIRKINDISKRESVTCSAQKLFKIDIEQNWNSRGNNKYYINFSLINGTNATFNVDSVVLNAQDQEGNILSFKRAKAAILKKTNVFELNTNDVIYDEFHFTNLQITLNKLNLTYDLRDKDLSITPFPISEITSNVSANLSIPRERRLNENSMLLTIANGGCSISNLTIDLLCGSPDASLELMERETRCTNASGEVVKIAASKEKGRALTFQIDAVEGNDIINIALPYSVKYKNQEPHLLKVKYRLTFTQDGQTHNHIAKVDIDPFLSVAVTVQDIFKSSILFTNFSIGSSDSKNPVRILDVDLSPSGSSGSNYKIQYPKLASEQKVAFSGQPIKFFAKVERLGKQIDDEDLFLKIRYRDLKEECTSILKTEFEKFFHNSQSKSNLARLLSKILDILEFKLSFYSFKNFIKAEAIDIGALTSSKEESKEMATFLSMFTASEGFKVKDVKLDDIERSLIIKVPMPEIPVIHEVELDFKKAPNYVIGSPISMKLLLRTTTSWSGNPPLSFDKTNESSLLMPASLGPPTPNPSRPTSPGLAATSSFVNGDGKYWEGGAASSTSTVDLNLEDMKSKKKKKMVTFETSITSTKSFQLELQTFDNWLISGSKRFTFEICPNGTHEFEKEPMSLVLIPLKVGRIPLPKIEIKELENGDVINDHTGIEINYKNSSETLVVVSDSDKISFDL